MARGHEARIEDFDSPTAVRSRFHRAYCLPTSYAADAGCKHLLTSFQTLCRTGTPARQSTIDGQECPSYVLRFCSKTCERVLKAANLLRPLVFADGAQADRTGRGYGERCYLQVDRLSLKIDPREPVLA